MFLAEAGPNGSLSNLNLKKKLHTNVAEYDFSSRLKKYGSPSLYLWALAILHALSLVEYRLLDHYVLTSIVPCLVSLGPEPS